MFKILNRKNADDKFDSSKHEITTKKDVNEILESATESKCDIDKDTKNFIDSLFDWGRKTGL